VTKLDWPRKPAMAALHFQERLLHGIFGVNGIAKNIPRQGFHARTMHRVETFIGAQIAGPAGSGQCGILARGIRGGRAGAAGNCSEGSTRVPRSRSVEEILAFQGQRKSHSSHSWLLGYRRRRRAKCQGCVL